MTPQEVATVLEGLSGWGLAVLAHLGVRVARRNTRLGARRRRRHGLGRADAVRVRTIVQRLDGERGEIRSHRAGRRWWVTSVLVRLGAGPEVMEAAT